MKTYNIDIDERVWNYLKGNAEPFEDTPNSVLNRLLFNSLSPLTSAHTFKNFINAIPAMPRRVPQALSQVLEVIFEVKRIGRSRIDATRVVARRRSRAPQTIIDKYCRQLGKKATEIDDLFKEENSENLKRLLEYNFKNHKDLIESYFKLLDGNEPQPIVVLNKAHQKFANKPLSVTECRDVVPANKPLEPQVPSYDELTQQVDKLKETVSESKDSETKFKTLFENANDLIVFINRDGVIYEINDKCERFFKLKREEMIGKGFAEFEEFFSEKMQDLIDSFNETFTGRKPLETYDQTIRHKDGSNIHLEMSSNFIEQDGERIGISAVIRDITDRKQAEEKLRRYRARLEELVKKRTAELEKSNSALRIMLQKESEVKKEFEEKLLFNVKELILPNLERLARSTLNETQRDYLRIIESNLDEIISSFSKNMSSRYFNLTPTELQIANLILHGKSTKDIANFLNLSINTIQFHRANIRNKMRIQNKKVNLRTFLQSLQK